MKLDLSKFKKAEDNDKFTILAHPSGHKIKISKKDLSSEYLSQIDNMPEHKAMGGPLEPRSQSHSRFSKPSADGKSSEKGPANNTPPAQTGYTEPSDLGTTKSAYIPGAPSKHEPDDISLGVRNAYYAQHGKYPPCINPSCKSYGHPHPNCL